MTTKLEQAAQALLAHWDTPAWKYLKPTGDLMADLREALGNSLKPKCFADYQPNHAIDRACASCAVAVECQTGEQAEQEPVHWTQREIHPNERRAMEAQAYPFIFPPLSKAAMREALAEQAEQEPVARVSGYYGGRCVVESFSGAMVFPKDMALYAAPVQQAEPVAWRVRGYNQFKTGNPAPWRYVDGADKPTVNKPDCCDFEPLYAAPFNCKGKCCE